MLLGGGAYAANTFVGSDGQIHRCVANKGQLAVLKPGGHCKKGQGKVAWNQRGRQGIHGVHGQTGVQGATGAGVNALYGDGSDANLVFTGLDFKLSRDAYYSDLTLVNTTIETNGFRVFVSGTLKFQGNSSIINEGGSTGLPSGTLGGSGGPNSDVSNSLGGDGGGGVIANPPSAPAGGFGVFHSALAAISGRSLDGMIVNGGAGGSGPQGGIGGGVVVVISTFAQPAGLTLSAQGGGGVGVGVQGRGGTTAWLN